MFSGLNWLAIVVCTVFSMVLGFVWYGPFFEKSWLRLTGLKKEELNPKDAMRGHLISLISSFIASTALAVIIKWMGFGLLNGLIAGGFFSFAFIVLTYFSNDTYERRPTALTLINTGYRFIYFVIIGIILGIWK